MFPYLWAIEFKGKSRSYKIRPRYLPKEFRFAAWRSTSPSEGVKRAVLGHEAAGPIEEALAWGIAADRPPKMSGRLPL